MRPSNVAYLRTNGPSRLCLQNIQRAAVSFSLPLFAHFASFPEEDCNVVIQLSLVLINNIYWSRHPTDPHADSTGARFAKLKSTSADLCRLLKPIISVLRCRTATVVIQLYVTSGPHRPTSAVHRATLTHVYLAQEHVGFRLGLEGFLTGPKFDVLRFAGC